MTPAQITQWAREAGWPDEWVDADELAVFAALVAAHEREECAKICEQLKTATNADEWADGYEDILKVGYLECAAAIRARTMAARPGEKG